MELREFIVNIELEKLTLTELLDAKMCLDHFLHDVELHIKEYTKTRPDGKNIVKEYMTLGV
jgi:hypothetical protein